jgi:Raf kinase inhibitor-like YbhB/YbcL family protein
MSFKVNNISKDRIVAVDQRVEMLSKKEAFKSYAPSINGGTIKNNQLRGGPNSSPQFSWYGAPSNTVEFVLIMHDETANFTHWIVYGIEPSTFSLPEAATLSKLGKNSYDTADYQGPDPPIPGVNHIYVFTLYALSKNLELLTTEPTRTQILTAMDGSIIVTTETIGMYES